MELGYRHPDELLNGLTSKQIAEWMTYGSIEPFGEYRSELRHGQLMHLLDTAHFKRDTPVRVVDFMNFTEAPEEKKLTPEEIERALAGIFGV